MLPIRSGVDPWGALAVGAITVAIGWSGYVVSLLHDFTYQGVLEDIGAKFCRDPDPAALDFLRHDGGLPKGPHDEPRDGAGSE